MPAIIWRPDRRKLPGRFRLVQGGADPVRRARRDYPFSAGRTPNVADDNEIALIQFVPGSAPRPRADASVSVPEPVSLLMPGFGLAGLLAARRRWS